MTRRGVQNHAALRGPGNFFDRDDVVSSVHRCRTFVIALAVLAATCAGSPAGPTEVDGNRIVVANDLRSLDAPLKAALAPALTRVLQALPMTGLTITVTADPSRIIPGWGLGGRTFDGNRVELYVDPAYPNLSSVLAERAAQLLAHECHHAARFRGPGYGATLLEAMVSEGMADHFAIEHMGAPVPPWSRALTPADLQVHLNQARPSFDSTSYGHATWFFGASPSIPNWAGYSIGYWLIEQYKAAHPGATATTLVNTPASAFRPS